MGENFAIPNVRHIVADAAHPMWWSSHDTLVPGINPRAAAPDDLQARLFQAKLLPPAGAFQEADADIRFQMTYGLGMYAPHSGLASLIAVAAELGRSHRPRHRLCVRTAMRTRAEVVAQGTTTDLQLRIASTTLNGAQQTCVRCLLVLVGMAPASHSTPSLPARQGSTYFSRCCVAGTLVHTATFWRACRAQSKFPGGIERIDLAQTAARTRTRVRA